MSRRVSFINIDEWIDRCSDAEPDSMIYEPDYSTDVAKVKTKAKENEIFELFRDVSEMCTKIGMTPDKIDDRLADIDGCISTYCQMLKQDVTEEFNKLCEYKNNLVEQIQKMLQDLYLPPYEPDNSVTMLQSCKRLRSKFQELDEVKQKRMIKLKELRDRQTRHCSTLGISQPPLDIKTGIPTEQELNQLQEAVFDLEKEERKRRERYNTLKTMIEKCMMQLDYQLETETESKLLSSEPSFTETNLKLMSNLHSKLETLFAAKQEELNKLTQTLISLYDRLDVPQKERDDFLKSHNTCKPSIMAQIQDEISRYEILKRENIGKFITKIKDELKLEYDRCFIPAETQEDFLSLSAVGGTNEGDEQLLELYERELDRIKQFYQDNKEILDKFHKWRNMWQELIELELNANDPSRFNNRGGQLLLEERKRKALQKGLPKLEKELYELNNKYAKANGSKFQVFKTSMDEFISGCWTELTQAREEEKKKRQNAKSNDNALKTRKPLQPQVVVPRKSPAKRAFGGATGVTPTPTKLLRKPTNFSALSLDEAEFESQIISCPTSAKKIRYPARFDG